MKKLSKYVLTICVLVLAFTPIISSAAELKGCNQPSQNLSNPYLGMGDLRELYSGLFDDRALDSQTCNDGTCSQDAQSGCSQNALTKYFQKACGQTTCRDDYNALKSKDVFLNFKNACI